MLTKNTAVIVPTRINTSNELQKCYNYVVCRPA